jgi:hypothetical protein
LALSRGYYRARFRGYPGDARDVEMWKAGRFRSAIMVSGDLAEEVEPFDVAGILQAFQELLEKPRGLNAP